MPSYCMIRQIVLAKVPVLWPCRLLFSGNANKRSPTPSHNSLPCSACPLGEPENRLTPRCSATHHRSILRIPDPIQPSSIKRSSKNFQPRKNGHLVRTWTTKTPGIDKHVKYLRLGEQPFPPSTNVEKYAVTTGQSNQDRLILH